ncbi:DnaD domain protein [Clostridium sp. M62/1]|uniref:DnaD domain protein n=1 Tax=Clostridium sp. M62/1 TaxID=411486 RepID=UPI000A02D6DC|nr:DnaD domain protein [Clostridium sp. M62/1]
MGQFIQNRLAHEVTVIPNEFIDRYMAEANGEYVKVYLYILRHGGSADDVSEIADALNHTEADVRRALVYWERVGVLALTDRPAPARPSVSARQSPAPLGGFSLSSGQGVSASGQTKPCQGAGSMEGGSPGTGDILCRLSGDEEFSQLLYIAQKYLNRTFTPTDCDVLANLYGNLHMPTELLEYLIESCAQNGHTSIRYIEKVGLSWHERGFKTAEEAKSQSMGYKKDIFAVMKAFGLSGRNPANGEIDLMDKWFGTYGFTREIVVEACNRTMAAIHKPSFQYTDSILTEWNRAGVRTMRDVEEVTRMRKEEARRARESGQSASLQAGARGAAASARQTGTSGSRRQGARKSSNRFHNLEEHGYDYDYDEMIWNMINTGASDSPGEPQSVRQEARGGENPGASRGFPDK